MIRCALRCAVATIPINYIVVWTAILGGRDAQPAHAQPRDEVAMGRYLLDAVLHAREELISGEFTADDHVLIQTTGGQVKTEWKARVDCAFDLPTRRLRFDYLSDDDPKQGFYLIERLDGAVFHGALSPSLEIVPLAKLPKLRPDRFFDVHLIGLVSPSETRSRRLAEVAPLFEQAGSLVGRPGEAAGTNWLVMILGNYGAERHILVNESQGNSPVRFEMRYLNRETNQVDPTPQDPIDLIWAQHGEVWVPTQLTWTVSYGDGAIERREVSFTWNSVNQPVAASRFDRRTIPLAPGTVVGDSRLDPGHPVLVETVPQASEVPRLPTGGSESTRWRIWFVVGNLAVLALIVGVVSVRRRRVPGSSVAGAGRPTGGSPGGTAS